MNFLQDVPAIRRIETDRADLVAIDMVGRAAAADAENLFGLLEAAYALHSRIDVLVRTVDLESVDWSEISAQTLRRGKAEAVRRVARCAAVGEPDWTSHAEGWFEPSIAVDLRHFDAADEAAAWEWLDARPGGGASEQDING